MRTRFSFRRLFLKRKKNIPRNEIKRLMLTGFLAFLSFSVAVFYSVFDLLNGVLYSQVAYGILIGSAMLSVFFLRTGRFRMAKIILIISTNLVVFWSAVTDPFETGVFLFFIPTGIGSFAMLGAEDIRIAISLAVFTTTLFLVAYLGDYRPIEVPVPGGNYIKMSFLFNYFISLTVCILAITFLMNLNRHSENELIQKEIIAKRRNKELQKVNVELDRFVYSVSHDLRSPLSSIQGLINIAKLTKDPDELSRILYMIEGRVNSQDHFIREIIDYARNARTETVSEPFLLKPLVEEVIGALQFSLGAEKISFRVRIDDNTKLVSDRVRLKVILSNLIGNAIKYHNVRKADPFIEISYDEASSSIQVRDNGSGILPVHLDKIFNMFFRASESSTGSGLGLFITRETVLKMGGSIEVTSQYDEGSTFTVFIPRKEPRAT